MSELGVVALVVTLAVAGAVALRGRPLGPGATWGWGWVVLFGAFLGTTWRDTAPWIGSLGLVFGGLFAWVQLAGARRYAEGADPIALVGVGLAVATLRAGLVVGGHPVLGHGLTTLADPIVLTAAAFYAWRGERHDASPSERLLPVAFLALALLETAEGVAFMRGVDPEGALLGWAILAPLTWLCQTTALGRRASAWRAERERRREEALRALAASESRFRALAANSEDWICEIDADDRIVYLSPRFEERTGLALSGFVGRSVSEVFAPDQSETAWLRFRRALEEGEGRPLLWRWPAEGDDPRWFETRVRSFETARGDRHAVTSTRDVTERRRMEHALRRARDELEVRVAERTRALEVANAELEREVAERRGAVQALRESEERYRRISELASDYSYGVRFGAGGSEEILWVTGAFTRITGYEIEEARRDWSSIVHPEDWPDLLERYRRLRAGGEMEHDFRITTKAGEERWLRERVRLEAESGGTHLFYAAAHDVTERKRARDERERMQARLHRSRHLESLGVMAGGVAHDFNNLLTPILGNTRAGLEELPHDSPVRGRLERVERAGRVAAALVRQMLTYAGRDSFDARPLDLSHLVDDTLAVLGAEVLGGVRPETDLPSGLPPVLGDETQIRQVILNLTKNAAEAVRGGGSVSVRTRVEEVGADLLDCALHGENLEPGRFLVLEVRDDGVGMDADAREHVFEPFYSTKRTGRGLGLAAVLGIVHGHGGAILLDSEPGAGTRFRVLFPVAGVLPPASPEPPAGPSRTAGRRVLLVDDEEAVAELSREFLERAGFVVEVAAGGRAGLDAFRAHRERIDAVVLDWRMPDLDGRAVLEGIRALAPGVPVVIASGLDEPARGQLPGPGPLARVRKPFEGSDLVDAVRAVLAEGERDGPAQSASPACR